MIITYTVEPPIKDLLRKGQPLLHYEAHTFSTSKKRTASLQRKKWLGPKCPLLGGSTVIALLIVSTFH